MLSEFLGGWFEKSAILLKSFSAAEIVVRQLVNRSQLVKKNSHTTNNKTAMVNITNEDLTRRKDKTTEEKCGSHVNISKPGSHTSMIGN